MPPTSTSWSSAPVPEGTSPRSAPPSSASRWASWRRSTGAGSASTSAASPPRRCCATPRSRTSSPTRRRRFGIEGDATMAFGPTHERSRKVADASAKGVHYLMKKNKITEIDGWGTLTGARPTASRGQRRQGRHHLVVHLRQPDRRHRREGADAARHVGQRQRRHLRGADPRREPARESIIIGGSGAIGVEFAYVMANFGVDVTIVEFLDRMVPDRGRRRVQGAAQALQEARREGAALDQGRERRGHRQRRQGHRQPRRRRRQPGARGRQDARGVRVRPAGRGLRPRRRPASSSPTAARSRSTPAAAPTSRASTRSATSPAS